MLERSRSDWDELTIEQQREEDKKKESGIVDLKRKLC